MDMPIPDGVSRDLKPAVLAAPVVQAWRPKKYIGKPDANAPRFIGTAGNETWETGEWSQIGTNRRPQIKGFDTAFLMLLVFTALYIQIDPRIWTGICQLLARLMIGTN
jgi:hypothetical protein